jgi:RNA polymerase sigma-70 factor (ECF subfamily)
MSSAGESPTVTDLQLPANGITAPAITIRCHIRWNNIPKGGLTENGYREAELMRENLKNERVCAEMIELIPALRSFARRLDRNPSNVDDLVQDTLMRAIANIDKFQEGTSLKSWMFTILRNTFCTKFGLAKREIIGIENCASARPSVNAPQEWSVRANEFHRALLGLPKHYRDAIDIILLQGLSYEAASERCGCPVGTIKSRVNRARAQLADQLN